MNRPEASADHKYEDGVCKQQRCFCQSVSELVSLELFGAFCCKVNKAQTLTPAHLFPSHSTAGDAVSDKRVLNADQASLPGIQMQGKIHILAQIGIHVHTHGSGQALLTQATAYLNASSHTMPPVLKEEH